MMTETTGFQPEDSFPDLAGQLAEAEASCTCGGGERGQTPAATGVMRWRKRPVEVEARLFDPGADYDEALSVVAWCGGSATDEGCEITTLEGVMLATPGDWVIRGVSGEFYPCKPEIFAKTYEPASSSELAATEDRTDKDGGMVAVSREDLRLAVAVADRLNVAALEEGRGQMTVPEMAVFDRLSAAAGVE